MTSDICIISKINIYCVSGGIVAFEKKYADAYKELLASESPPKWMGNSSLRSQEKKVHSLMVSFTEAKLTVELFLEQLMKSGINVIDLTEDG